ncbi:MAG: hypothetical protein ACR2RB_00095 [Gammaproteobacteria bacterium]
MNGKLLKWGIGVFVMIWLAIEGIQTNMIVTLKDDLRDEQQAASARMTERVNRHEDEMGHADMMATASELKARVRNLERAFIGPR